MSELQGKTWREVPLGGAILKPGSSAEYETGSWRTYRPIHSQEKCIHCLICWSVCPEFAIQVENGKIKGIDYRYCKGCGLCAEHCPPKVKAITMVLETEAKKSEG